MKSFLVHILRILLVLWHGIYNLELVKLAPVVAYNAVVVNDLNHTSAHKGSSLINTEVHSSDSPISAQAYIVADYHLDKALSDWTITDDYRTIDLCHDSVAYNASFGQVCRRKWSLTILPPGNQKGFNFGVALRTVDAIQKFHNSISSSSNKHLDVLTDFLRTLLLLCFIICVRRRMLYGPKRRRPRWQDFLDTLKVKTAKRKPKLDAKTPKSSCSCAVDGSPTGSEPPADSPQGTVAFPLPLPASSVAGGTLSEPVTKMGNNHTESCVPDALVLREIYPLLESNRCRSFFLKTEVPSNRSKRGPCIITAALEIIIRGVSGYQTIGNSAFTLKESGCIENNVSANVDINLAQLSSFPNVDLRAMRLQLTNLHPTTSSGNDFAYDCASRLPTSIFCGCLTQEFYDNSDARVHSFSIIALHPIACWSVRFRVGWKNRDRYNGSYLGIKPVLVASLIASSSTTVCTSVQPETLVVGKTGHFASLSTVSAAAITQASDSKHSQLDAECSALCVRGTQCIDFAVTNQLLLHCGSTITSVARWLLSQTDKRHVRQHSQSDNCVWRTMQMASEASPALQQSFFVRTSRLAGADLHALAALSSLTGGIFSSLAALLSLKIEDAHRAMPQRPATRMHKPAGNTPAVAQGNSVNGGNVSDDDDSTDANDLGDEPWAVSVQPADNTQLRWPKQMVGALWAVIKETQLEVAGHFYGRLPSRVCRINVFDRKAAQPKSPYAQVTDILIPEQLSTESASEPHPDYIPAIHDFEKKLREQKRTYLGSFHTHPKEERFEPTVADVMTMTYDQKFYNRGNMTPTYFHTIIGPQSHTVLRVTDEALKSRRLVYTAQDAEEEDTEYLGDPANPKYYTSVLEGDAGSTIKYSANAVKIHDMRGRASVSRNPLVKTIKGKSDESVSNVLTSASKKAYFVHKFPHLFDDDEGSSSDSGGESSEAEVRDESSSEDRQKQKSSIAASNDELDEAALARAVEAGKPLSATQLAFLADRGKQMVQEIGRDGVKMLKNGMNKRMFSLYFGGMKELNISDDEDEDDSDDQYHTADEGSSSDDDDPPNPPGGGGAAAARMSPGPNSRAPGGEPTDGATGEHKPRGLKGGDGGISSKPGLAADYPVLNNCSSGSRQSNNVSRNDKDDPAASASLISSSSVTCAIVHQPILPSVDPAATTDLRPLRAAVAATSSLAQDMPATSNVASKRRERRLSACKQKPTTLLFSGIKSAEAHPASQVVNVILAPNHGATFQLGDDTADSLKTSGDCVGGPPANQAHREVTSTNGGGGLQDRISALFACFQKQRTEEICRAEQAEFGHSRNSRMLISVDVLEELFKQATLLEYTSRCRTWMQRPRSHISSDLISFAVVRCHVCCSKIKATTGQSRVGLLGSSNACKSSRLTSGEVPSTIVECLTCWKQYACIQGQRIGALAKGQAAEEPSAALAAGDTSFNESAPTTDAVATPQQLPGIGAAVNQQLQIRNAAIQMTVEVPPDVSTAQDPRTACALAGENRAIEKWCTSSASSSAQQDLPPVLQSLDAPAADMRPKRPSQVSPLETPITGSATSNVEQADRSLESDNAGVNTSSSIETGQTDNAARCLQKHGVQIACRENVAVQLVLRDLENVDRNEIAAALAPICLSEIGYQNFLAWLRSRHVTKPLIPEIRIPEPSPAAVCLSCGLVGIGAAAMFAVSAWKRYEYKSLWVERLQAEWEMYREQRRFARSRLNNVENTQSSGVSAPKIAGDDSAQVQAALRHQQDKDDAKRRRQEADEEERNKDKSEEESRRRRREAEEERHREDRAAEERRKKDTEYWEEQRKRADDQRREDEQRSRDAAERLKRERDEADARARNEESRRNDERKAEQENRQRAEEQQKQRDRQQRLAAEQLWQESQRRAAAEQARLDQVRRDEDRKRADEAAERRRREDEKREAEARKQKEEAEKKAKEEKEKRDADEKKAKEEKEKREADEKKAKEEKEKREADEKKAKEEKEKREAEEKKSAAIAEVYRQMRACALGERQK